MLLMLGHFSRRLKNPVSSDMVCIGPEHRKSDSVLIIQTPKATTAVPPVEYAKAVTMKTIAFLENAATLVPFPFVKDAIHIALIVLQACEVRQLLRLDFWICSWLFRK
jgi:hypothetical protein